MVTFNRKRGMVNELALFFGGGGGLLGSQLIGHRVVCGVEIDPYCREIVMRRQEEGYLPAFPIWDDATTFNGRPWRGSVDIVTAGFPCQPWSLAGKRRGIDDKRNLWPCTYRIIQEVRPGLVLLENVPGIRKFLPVVIRDLRRAQYTVKRPLIVAAAAVGAGYIRKRIWILAYDEKQHRGEQANKQTSDHRRLYKVSPDDFSMRQWEQQRGRQGQGRTAAAIGTNTTKTDISSDFDGLRKLESEGEFKYIRGRNLYNNWWDREPGLARLVHRPPYRVERIRITGNIQVPAVVREAWNTLLTESEDW